MLTSLCSKERLDTSDIMSLLHCIQEESTPFLTSKQAITLGLSTDKHDSRLISSRLTQDSKRLPCNVSSSQTEASGHRQSRGGKSKDSSTTKKSRGRGRGESPHVEGGAVVRKEKVFLDLSNDEEFPPMTPAMKQQKKGRSSSGPPRRIKPTSLQSTPHTATHFTVPTPTHSHRSTSPWKPSPTFTKQSTLSSSADEQKVTPPKSQKYSESNHHAIDVSADSFTSSASKTPDHLKRLEQRISGARVGDSLSLKISTHSIFDLTNSQDSPSEYVFNTSKSNLNPTTTPPIKVTPPAASTPILAILQVSREGVSNEELVEKVACMYSSLIKDGRVPNLTSQMHFIIQLLTMSQGRAGSHKLQHDSSRLFESINNCVYFAVSVLDKIRSLLLSLDRATLQLLVENPRVETFQPGLVSFLTQACQNRRQEAPKRALLPPASTRVPFLEEQDGSRNFPSMRAFHTFKKQRDLFYSVFRDWEGNHSNQGWSFQETQCEKIRILIRQYGEVCSLSHLARLFTRQLIDTCKHPVSAGDLYSGLAGHIKNTDPQRLRRLTERFFLPRTSGAGPCPPPSFSLSEEFFRAFIVEADSYLFNQHLRDALYKEISKLHTSCSSIETNGVPDLLQTLRSVAKFLGLLEFLPYTHPTIQLNLSRDMHICTFGKFIFEAKVRGHLSLTVPWVVQYMSMMDPQAAMVPHYRQLIVTLIDLYREVLSDYASFTSAQFLIVTSLGWLFENPHMPSELFFDHLRNPTPLPIHHSTADSVCVDSEPHTVTTSVVYACCPYLNELRSLLTEFASGNHSQLSPMRKIKPLSTSFNKLEDSPSHKLQVQLRESFFRGHPPYLKQVCDVTSERVVAVAIDHCTSVILPRAVSKAVCLMGEWMKQKCNEWDPSRSSSTIEPVTREDAERQALCVLDSIYTSLHSDISLFTNKHCTFEPVKVLNILLADSQSLQIVNSANAVCSEMASEKISKWIEEKVKNLFLEELLRSVERVRRSLKSVMKARSQNDGKTVEIGEVDLHPRKKTDRFGAIENSSILVKQFEESIISVLKMDGLFSVSDVLEVTQHIVDHLEVTAFVLPGVPLQNCLPPECKRLPKLTVKFAIDQITKGLLSAREAGTETVKIFISLWKSIKGLKIDIPFHDLLSTEAFGRFMEQEKVDIVWQSLASVLIAILNSDLVSSALMEGMWLCRHLQVPEEQQQLLLRGAVVFLCHWYSQCGTQHDHVTTQISCDRRIHFTRLLSVVINHLEPKSLPNELLSEELATLVSFVHPF